MSIAHKIKKVDGLFEKVYDATPSDQYWAREKENRLHVAESLFGKKMARRHTKAGKYALYDKIETKTRKMKIVHYKGFLIGMQHLLEKQLAEASR